MTAYLLRRLIQSFTVCLGVATLAFLIVRLSGDPTTLLLPPQATIEDAKILRDAMGLNQPLPVQYVKFLAGAVRGDFGNSFWIAKPALALIWERMPATAELTLAGLAVAVVVGISAGVISAVRRYSWFDNVATFVAVAGQAMPSFWLGLMLILLLSVRLRIFPASGMGSPAQLVLPAITLSSFLAPVLVRLTRSGMLDVLAMDYIRTARAKGLRDRLVLWRHGFRNALVPVATVVGLQFGRLLGGAVVTETVFAWPGIGSLVVQSIRTSDYPVVQAAVVVLAITIVLANLITDVVIAGLDPRIRYA